MKILILGGTAEARMLAARLVALGHEVVTSLAGRTADPLRPAGTLRVGGFGGAEALGSFIAREAFDRVVDATHPYAAKMHAHAVSGAARADCRLVRLVRAPWQAPPDASWVPFQSDALAAASLPDGARVFLTVGQTQLATYLERRDCRFVVRLLASPTHPLAANALPVVGRPPFDVAGELALLRQHAISHLVSKNSGGAQTEAKLQAAQQLGIAICMVERPALPPAHEVDTVEAAIAALELPPVR